MSNVTQCYTICDTLCIIKIQDIQVFEPVLLLVLVLGCQPTVPVSSKTLFRDDDNCYYGHSSHAGSTFTDWDGTSWDVYMKSGKKTK